MSGPVDPTYSLVFPHPGPIHPAALVLDTQPADAVLPEDGGLLAIELRIAAVFDFRNGVVAMKAGNTQRANQLTASALIKVERAAALEIQK